MAPMLWEQRGEGWNFLGSSDRIKEAKTVIGDFYP